MIKRIVFDLDNTLINWEDEYWHLGIIKACEELNIPYTMDMEKRIINVIDSYENKQEYYDIKVMQTSINKELGKDYSTDFIKTILKFFEVCVPKQIDSNVEKTLRKFNTAKYCGNTELALSLLDQADRELKICIKEAKKLISEEKRKQARAIAESNKKYEEELKAIAHNTLEEAKRKLMGLKNQPDLNQKSQEIERSNEDLTDEDEEWARKMQEIIDKKRSQKQSDHEPLNEEQQFAHNMIGEIKAKLMGAFKKEKKERECDNV